MAEQSFASSENQGNNKVLWYVLAGVVTVAIFLGVALWLYGNSLVEEAKPTPKPVVNVTPTPNQSLAPTVAPSPTTASINVVSESKSVTFPKAGRVYLYYIFFDSTPTALPYVFDLVSASANISVQTPSGLPTPPAKMHIVDTGMNVVAGETIAIQPYDFGNFDSPSIGWIKPVNETTCGAPNHLRSEPEIFSWMRSSINATGEPIVSIQCWGDGGPTTDQDYNDFLLVLTYGAPTSTASTSPSAAPSIAPSVAPSIAPSVAPVVSPSPSIKASTTSAITTSLTTTPTIAPRTAEVDTSAGVPVTGVIEDTIKYFGLGIGMIILGLLIL